MSRVCPECGREYFGQTVKCIHCNIPLVEKSGSPTTQQTRGKTTQQTRQTAAQINYQRIQQARAEQEKAHQQQLEQLQSQQQAILSEQKQAKVAKNKKKQGIPMKTWKLVSGSLSIIMFVFVTFQSCAAGAYNALSSNGEVSGSAGALVAVMLLAGGIVSIACRKGNRGGNIAIAILYGIGSFVGVMMAGSYTDLKVWSFWCLVCSLLATISISGFKTASIITTASLFFIWTLFVLFFGSNDIVRTNKTVNNDSNSSAIFETNKGLFTVDLTVPADYAGNHTQQELNETAEEFGYDSITLNVDGSITYKMTKRQHEELMDETRKEINNQLQDMIGGEDYPSFTDIKANSDFTEFTVTTTSEDLNMTESMSIFVFYTYGGLYSAFSGKDIDNIHVKYVNQNTGNVISEADSKDL